MVDVTIYTRPGCGFCMRAKDLLRSKGVDYREIDVWSGPGLQDEMIERAGGRTTVPQIFVGERHVGGCDDLHDLDAAGELDGLLRNPETS